MGLTSTAWAADVDRTPFIVLGTPRSRTAWLSNWLSTDARPCLHDALATIRNVDQLRAVTAKNDLVETAGSIFCRTLLQHVPNAKFAFVVRDKQDVAASLNRLLPEGDAVAEFADNAIEEAWKFLWARAPHIRLHHSLLDNEEHLRRLWVFLKGDHHGYDAERTRRLMRLNVTKINPFAGTPPEALLREERRLSGRML